MNKFTVCAAIAMSVLCMQGALAADSKADKQAQVRKMCDEALATLYKAKPSVQQEIARSAGYGCFSSFGISFIVGGAGGSGLVYDNASKHTTYMNMGQASAGIDVSIRNYREVLVFRDKATIDKFTSSGWELAGSAQATAKAGSTGGGAEAAAVGNDAKKVQDPITIYPITKTGLALGAAATGRKYWKSDDLN